MLSLNLWAAFRASKGFEGIVAEAPQSYRKTLEV